MTQAELSRQAHVTISYVSRLESGKIAPGIDMVERLAAALGAAVTDLLPATRAPDALAVLKAQAKRLLETLLERGNPEAFLRLNPYLALLVEASTKRPR
jgi:transcriptional regulator with XRE-family HTH domain